MLDAVMETGLAGFHQIGGVPRQQYAIACLAQIDTRISRTDNAPTMLDEALARVERSGEKVDLTEILPLRGEVVLAHDASATAEAERRIRACRPRSLVLKRPNGANFGP